MRLKPSIGAFILIVSLTNLCAIDVLVTKNKIAYKEQVKTTSLMLRKVETLQKGCTPLSLQQLQKEKYITTHYIRKNKIICLKDIKAYKKQSVVFKFGAIEIEKNGKLIRENEKYITIKREDGKIEKIYKDGKNR